MTICLSTNGPAITHLEEAPNRILVATLSGIVEFTKDASTSLWNQAGVVLPGKHISALMRLPKTDTIFAGAHNGGLFCSDDGGRTFKTADSKFETRHIFSLDYCDYGKSRILYAGTEPVSLLCSIDDGLTWEELPSIGRVPGNEKWTFPPPPHHAHTKCFLFDPNDAKVIYAGVEQGALLKSEDGGQSWRELDGFYRPDHVWYKDIHRVVRDPANFERIYMATGMGLFRSEDRGETWSHLTGTDSAIGYPDQLFVLPGNGDLLMSGASKDPSTWRITHEAHGTIMRSINGGRDWAYADHGLPRKGRANIEAFHMCVFPGGAMLLCGNTDGDIFESHDLAGSWSRVAAGTPPVSKGGHFRNLQAASAG